MRSRKVICMILTVVLFAVSAAGCGKSAEITANRHAQLPDGYEEVLSITPTEPPSPYIDFFSQFLNPSPTGPVTPGVSGHDHKVNRRGYSMEDITEYFDEVVLHAEYGSNDNHVHKWTSPIILCVKGEPTAQDRIVLQTVIMKMNSVYGFPGIRETMMESEANLVITFASDDEYERITPSNIDDATDGFATCWWRNSVIYDASIGIRTSIPQTERNSVIWEEIVQATGLQNDSYLYPDSLFYQGYNEVQEPTQLDWILIELLYHPDMTAGTLREHAIILAATLLE